MFTIAFGNHSNHSDLTLEIIKLIFITIIIVFAIKIVIIHLASSFLFYPYNLFSIGCKAMFLAWGILIILF